MKSKTLYLLLLSLFFCLTINGQTKEECNSLIEKGSIASQKDNNTIALELFLKANAMAVKNKWYKQEYKSLIGLGNSYSRILEVGTAHDYYIKAYNLAIKYDYDIVIIWNNIGKLYLEEGDFSKANEYLNKSYELAKAKKLKTIGIPLMNLAKLANSMDNPELAQKYVKEVLPYIKENFRDSISTHLLLVESYLLQRNTKLAREKALDLINCLKGKSGYNKLRNNVQSFLIESYLDDLNYKEAITNSNELLLQNPDLNHKTFAFISLAQAYQKIKLYDLAFQYNDSVISTMMEWYAKKNAKLFESSKVKFEVEKYKNQTAIHQHKLISERKIFYALLIIAIASIIIIILLFRQKNLRNKHRNILELEQEKNAKLALEKQITDTLLEFEILKNEVENKDKKLYSKELFLSDRNALIEEITTSLLKSTYLLNDKKIVDNIKALKNHLKTDAGLDNFIVHFEKVNSGFLTRLKGIHPDLNQNDIKFIAYIYMNLNVKEIAVVLNITVGACKKRKERIATKMNISEDSDIYSYILTI